MQKLLLLLLSADRLLPLAYGLLVILVGQADHAHVNVTYLTQQDYDQIIAERKKAQTVPTGNQQ